MQINGWPSPWKLRLLFWWARMIDVDIQPCPNALRGNNKVAADAPNTAPNPA